MNYTEVFEKIKNGELVLEEFETWVEIHKEKWYDIGYDNGRDDGYRDGASESERD